MFKRILNVLMYYDFDFNAKCRNKHRKEHPSAWEYILSTAEYNPGLLTQHFYAGNLNQLKFIVEKHKKKFELYMFLDRISKSRTLLQLDESHSEEQKKPLINYINSIIDFINNNKELIIARKCLLFHLHHQI